MERHSFALEHLEERALFSVVAPTDMGLITANPRAISPVRVASHNPLAGAFNVAGTFTHPLGNPDAGSLYNFTGSGKTDSLGGKFTLTGHLTAPGFINNGRARGEFVITTSRGTITVSGHGPPQTPGTLPSSFTFSIKKGTRAYANSSGKGQFLISASGTTHKFLFRFNQSS